MAVFNPAPPPTNDPTYGKESRAFEKDVVVDRTYDTLFKGLGNLVGIGVKGAIEGVQKDIDLNLYKEIDEERAAVGVDDTAAMAAYGGNAQDRTKEGVSRRDPPGELNHLGPQVERLNQANAAGKLSNRYYYARLESLVRSFRARYPGFRDYIDQKVSEITGVTPANALRASILQEFEEAQRKGESEVSKRLNLQKELGQYVDPVTEAKFAKGEISPEQYIFEANKKRRYVSNMDMLRSEYQLMGDVKNWNDKGVRENLTNRGRIIVKDTMGSLSNIFPGGINGLNQLITDIATGTRKVNEQEIGMVAMRAGRLFNVAKEQIREELMRPNSKGQVPDPKMVNELVNELTVDMDNLIKNITTDPKDLQVVGMTARRYNAIGTDDKLSLILDERFGNVARTVQAWKGVAGESFIGPALGTVLNSRARSLLEMTLPTAATQDEFMKKFNKPFTMSEAAKIAVDAGEASPEVGDSIVKIAEMLGDPKTDPRAAEKLAVFAFSPSNMDFIQKHIPPADQQAVYQRLTSPAIIKRLQSMNNPEMLENFKFWAKNEFKALFSKHINDAHKLTFDPDMPVFWDVDNKMFRFSEPRNLGPIQSAALASSLPKYKAVIDELNRGISSFKRVLDLDGEDAASRLYMTLVEAGYNVNEQPSSFMDMIGKLLEKAATAMQKGAAEGRARSKDPL